MADLFNTIWNSPSRYVIIFIAVIMILYIPGMFIYMNHKKKGSQMFLQQHPDAAKVLLGSSMSGQFTIFSVNDEKPETFYESNKMGFYLLPGTSNVNLQFAWSRPGVLHKTVTTVIGPTTLDFTVDANKRYILKYDKSEEKFIINEE